MSVQGVTERGSSPAIILASYLEYFSISSLPSGNPAFQALAFLCKDSGTDLILYMGKIPDYTHESCAGNLLSSDVLNAPDRC